MDRGKSILGKRPIKAKGIEILSFVWNLAISTEARFGQ